MLEHFDARPLTPAEVYSALAYYHDHKQEIEASRSTIGGVVEAIEALAEVNEPFAYPIIHLRPRR